MSSLVKNHVEYFVRDPYCLGRSYLDLGLKVEASFDEKGLDIRCRMHSNCWRMLNGGCPRDLPGYDAELAERRRLNGVRLGKSYGRGYSRGIFGKLCEGTSSFLFSPRFCEHQKMKHAATWPIFWQIFSLIVIQQC
jgi:hypothetical protein